MDKGKPIYPCRRAKYITSPTPIIGYKTRKLTAKQPDLVEKTESRKLKLGVPVRL